MRTLLPSLIVLTTLGIAGCGSNSGGSSPDAASDVQNDSPAACPADRPSTGAACTQTGPMGCYYPDPTGCGGATCTCNGGGWSCFTGAGSCDASASDGSGEGGGTGEAGAGDGALTDGDTCPIDPPPFGGSCSGGLSCTYCDGGELCDCNAGQWECGGSMCTTGDH